MSFTTLFEKAYAEEFWISNVIRSILLNYDDEAVWNAFFQLLGDTCRHMDMLSEIVELLGYDRREFKEDALTGPSSMEPEISDEFAPAIFKEALKWEKYARRFYSHMLRYFSENVAEEMDEDVSEKIKNMLSTLLEDESKHIEIIEEFIAGHVVLPGRTTTD